MQVAILSLKKRLSNEEYDALPADSRWMAYETARLQRNLYMLVLPHPGHDGGAFYYRSGNLLTESAFIAEGPKIVNAGHEDNGEFEVSETDDKKKMRLRALTRQL